MFADPEFAEKVKNALARLERVGSPLEFAKLSTALYDRLIVIDGAALTVSLSAIGNHHMVYGTDLSFLGKVALGSAWVAFITSIVLALATNWLHVSSYTETEIYLEAHKSLEEIAAEMASRQSPTIDAETRANIEEIRDLADWEKLRSRSSGTRRRRAGAAAQILTVLGFAGMGIFLIAALRK